MAAPSPSVNFRLTLLNLDGRGIATRVKPRYFPLTLNVSHCGSITSFQQPIVPCGLYKIISLCGPFVLPTTTRRVGAAGFAPAISWLFVTQHKRDWFACATNEPSELLLLHTPINRVGLVTTLRSPVRDYPAESSRGGWNCTSDLVLMRHMSFYFSTPHLNNHNFTLRFGFLNTLHSVFSIPSTGCGCRTRVADLMRINGKLTIPSRQKHQQSGEQRKDKHGVLKRRESNPRLSPNKGDALPSELL